MPLHQSQALKLALQKNPFFFQTFLGFCPRVLKFFPRVTIRGMNELGDEVDLAQQTILNSLDLTNSSHSLWQKFMPERLCT